MIKVSLIVSTYNWPEALELTLLSILKQSRFPHEVIIADDGSKSQTKDLIEKFKKKTSIPIIHVWQEDEGFQLAKIRNKAFAESTGEYIIQIDGDLILHRDFVKDHINLSQPNCFIQGGRVLLGRKISEQLFKTKDINISIFSADIKRREEGIRWLGLSNYLSTRYRNKYPRYFARGANMSFWKTDLETVNGYNEDFSGWGHEDSDLTARALNAGNQKLILKFAGIAYHLFHNEHSTKHNSGENELLLQDTVKRGIVYIEKGMNQYTGA
ncbi:MAG: glycosyltransferase [Pedobacter sp.]|nr:MAG: glycosyltransferase [Pedobacter sp.]